MATTRDVVHLHADPVRVLEQHRVVAGGEVRRLLGGVHDVSPELPHREVMDPVDVLALPGPEAEVVQPRAVLVEGLVTLLGRRPAYQDAGAAADAVDDALSLDQGLHLEEVAELLPEREAAVGIVHGQLDVGDAVDFDAHGSPPGGESESRPFVGPPAGRARRHHSFARLRLAARAFGACGLVSGQPPSHNLADPDLGSASGDPKGEAVAPGIRKSTTSGTLHSEVPKTTRCTPRSASGVARVAKKRASRGDRLRAKARAAKWSTGTTRIEGSRSGITPTRKRPSS
jgi:hypothetical protein